MRKREASTGLATSFGQRLWWIASFALSLWGLLVCERVVGGVAEAEPLAEWLFLLRLACAATPWVALVWLGADWLAMRSRVGALVAGLGVSLCVGVGFWLVSVPISQGDGVQDLPIPSWLIAPSAGAVGAILAGVAWGSARLLRPLWAWPLQLAVCGGLMVFVAKFDRIQGGIASASLLLAALFLTCILWRWLDFLSGPRTVMHAALVAAMTFAALGSVHDAPWLERGRRAILADQRVPLHLSVLMFGADEKVLRAVRLTREGLTPEACRTLPTPYAPQPLTSDRSRRRNVLLVSVDALRRDALGAMVKGKRVAPHLYAWSQRAQLMERASTSYAATFFSVTGALTGLPASRIALSPTPPRTLFSIAAPIIPRRIAVLPESGTFFERPAFVGYALKGVEAQYPGGAKEQTNALLRFIADAQAHDQPFLAWVHYAEAHAPYKGHKGFRYGSSERERYLGEVAFVDAHFGRLMKQLEQDGVLEDTLIILFADHGEALGERGHHGHHLFLNRWVAEVPLIVHVPSGERVQTKAFAQTSDIAPTVLHFLGLASPHAMTGRSLLDESLPLDRPLFAEAFSTGASLTEFAQRPVHNEAELTRRMDLVQRGFGRYPPSVSITTASERLIVSRSTGLTMLYDTRRDPAERHDLSLERPTQRDALLAKLAAWHEEQSLAVYCATVKGK